MKRLCGGLPNILGTWNVLTLRNYLEAKLLKIFLDLFVNQYVLPLSIKFDNKGSQQKFV